jgi:arylsulfatase
LPKLFNLTTDPKEEYPEETLRNTWAINRCLKVVREFQDSLKKYPVVPEGLRETFRPEPTEENS